MEIRDVPSMPGWSVDDQGGVYYQCLAIKPERLGRRYYVFPTINGKRTVRQVSRMVCMAFHGLPPEDKPFALHRDDKPLDNRPQNLYWGDDQDNANDKIRNGHQLSGEAMSAQVRAHHPRILGTMSREEYGRRTKEGFAAHGLDHERWLHIREETGCCGETHYAAKLTTEQVSDLYVRYLMGDADLVQLGKEYGVTPALIGYIVHKQCRVRETDKIDKELWPLMTEDEREAAKVRQAVRENCVGDHNPNATLTAHQAREVYILRRVYGYSLKELAQQYGVTMTQVSVIANKKGRTVETDAIDEELRAIGIDLPASNPARKVHPQRLTDQALQMQYGIDPEVLHRIMTGEPALSEVLA